jgi:nucleotide-binding universal stress UspA family protein
MTDTGDTGDADDREAPGDANDRPTVLVPVEVLEGQTVPETLADFLAPARVVVLGYHVLPDQTPAEQASMQFEERAREAVADIAATFEAAGRDVETRVAFTHDRDQTVDRVAEEVGATAVLLSNPTGPVEDVLVSMRGVVDTGRLADLVATLLVDADVTVTLLALVTEDGEFEAQVALDRAAARLRRRGVPPERITTERTETAFPVRDVIDRSADFDAVVVGEGGESILSLLLGDEGERVAEGAVAPVLVVRRREPTE